MELSGQQNQASQHAPQLGTSPEPVPGSRPNTNFNNPLQGRLASQTPAAGQLQSQPPFDQPGIGRPASMPQAGPLGVSPAVPTAPQPAQDLMNDNLSDGDDVQWVNRAKRAIASTHGDPHRQVQLIQHLRSQYLKQRFGRTVHTDEV